MQIGKKHQNTMTSNLTNLDQFHKCIAVMLNMMYENFPNPIDIDVLYVEGKEPARKRVLVNFDDEMRSWDSPGNSSKSNPIKDEMNVYMNSIYYLRDEGYIQTKAPEHGQSQRTFSECRLTSKGLAALGRVGVKQRLNWGNLIHAAIKDGKYKVLQDLAVKVLSGGLS